MNISKINALKPALQGLGGLSLKKPKRKLITRKRSARTGFGAIWTILRRSFRNKAAKNKVSAIRSWHRVDDLKALCQMAIEESDEKPLRSFRKNTHL
jgi:hypothetical protein